MITKKTKEEIKILKKSGAILASILKKVTKEAKAGVSTAYLNNLAEVLIEKAGAKASFKGFVPSNPYPAALCTSVNSQVVHCVPDENVVLKDGDIIGLDLGIKYPAVNGLYTDMAVTIGIGKISPEAEKLIKVTKEALDLIIKKLKPGITSGDLGFMIQDFVENQGFSVVRELVGHGVGYQVHEEPRLPNFGKKGEGDILAESMVLAFEPMVNAGGWQVSFGDNGWNVETKDKSLSAHFEHTIIVTRRGCEVITK